MTGKNYLIIPVVLFSTIMLSGCASVPRSDAGKLADAGISTTSSLSVGLRDLASDLIYIDSSSAFSETFFKCNAASDKSLCSETIKSDANYLERQKLASLISSRAKAVDSLKNLYEAWKSESDYDAREDLTGALTEAYKSVDTYTAAINDFSGVAVIGRVAERAVGAFADIKQNQRILEANKQIRLVTKLYKEALTKESEIFEPIIDNIAKTRADTVKALFGSGLVQKSDVVMPLISEFNLTANPNLEKTKLSASTDKAIEAYITASSRVEIMRMNSQYKASIGALDALLKQHDKLSTEEALSFEDVNRFIDEVDFLVFGPGQEGE